MRQAADWHRRIRNLLVHHQFFLPGDDDTMYVCHLQPDGKFNIATFQKMEGVNADSTLTEVASARAKALAKNSEGEA